MKRAPRILALSLCALCALCGLSARDVRAQGSDALPSWTIFAAMNLANVEGPTDVNKEPLFGFAFGAAMDWRLNSVFAFHPELQYSEKGYQYNPSVAIKLKLTYIEIPLLLRASTEARENGMRLYGVFGPTVAMRRSCGASVGSAKTKCNVLQQNQSTMDFGLIGGFGLDFKVHEVPLTASVRYNLGLLDADKTNASARTRAFTLLFGYRL